jgi:hypothetical protein
MYSNATAKTGFTLAAVLFSLISGPALAQATRTWVSGVGDDANPCSRTAPCKTFAGAISKTAAGGEINAMDPGGFGAVTITKAITIDGGSGHIAGMISGPGNGIVVNAGAADVIRLRNLDINGAGGGLNGIRFIGGAALHVHNVHIFGFGQQGISFEVPAGRTSFLAVTDSRLENNNGGQVHVTGAGTPIASLSRVTMLGGQRGLRAEDGSSVNVKDSTAANHTGNGFIAAGTSRLVVLTLDGCTSFANTAAGVFAGAFANIFMTNCTISGNGTGILPQGGSIISSGTNTVQGNGNNGSPSLTSDPI